MKIVIVLAIMLSSILPQKCYGIIMVETGRGDTWTSIAREYNTTASVLKAINNNVIRLIVGTQLRVPVLIPCTEGSKTMSGGAFSYIQNKTAYDLLEDNSLESIIDALVSTYPESEALKLTRQVDQRLNAIRNELNSLDVEIAKLHDVWKGFDYWWASDWGKDRVDTAVASFNG